MNAREMLDLLAQEWWMKRDRGRPVSERPQMFRAYNTKFDVHIEVVEVDCYPEPDKPVMKKTDLKVIQRERIMEHLLHRKPVLLLVLVEDDMWVFIPNRTTMKEIHRWSKEYFIGLKHYWINDERLTRWVQKYRATPTQTPYLVRCFRSVLEKL
jgi:hypothetical protein